MTACGCGYVSVSAEARKAIEEYQPPAPVPEPVNAAWGENDPASKAARGFGYTSTQLEAAAAAPDWQRDTSDGAGFDGGRGASKKKHTRPQLAGDQDYEGGDAPEESSLRSW